MKIKKISAAVIGFVFALACSTDVMAQEGERPPKGERLTPAERFAKMDADNDGKISKEEAKGPLLKNFSTIDTNGDGFLTKEEVKNGRPPRKGKGRKEND